MSFIKDRIPHFFLRLPAFYIFGWLIHIITISVIAFFHFRLDHTLIVIENWILDLAWPVNLFSKTISFVIFFKYFYEGRARSIFEVIFDRKNLIPSFHTFALTVMNLAFFVYFSAPSYADNVLFDFGRTFTHAFSIFATLLIDLMVILVIENELKDKRHTIFKVFYSSVVVFIYFLMCFPMVKEIPFSLLYLLVLNFSYFFLFNRSVSVSMLFVLVVIIPLYCVLGFDPVWGNKFSALTSSIYSINLQSFCLMLAFSGYFYVIYRKRSSV